MIRSIFAERYKKVLIAACLLVIGVGVFNAVIQNNQWKEIYNDPNAKASFEENRNEITYWDEEKRKTYLMPLIRSIEILNCCFIRPICLILSH